MLPPSLHHFFHANTTLTVTPLFTIPLFIWRHNGGLWTWSFLVRSFPHSSVFSLLFLIWSFPARSLYSLCSPFSGTVRGGLTSLTIFQWGHHCFCIFEWGMHSPCFSHLISLWFICYGFWNLISFLFFEIWYKNWCCVMFLNVCRDLFNFSFVPTDSSFFSPTFSLGSQTLFLHSQIESQIQGLRFIVPYSSQM